MPVESEGDDNLLILLVVFSCLRWMRSVDSVSYFTDFFSASALQCFRRVIIGHALLYDNSKCSVFTDHIFPIEELA